MTEVGHDFFDNISSFFYVRLLQRYPPEELVAGASGSEILRATLIVEIS